MSGSESFSGSLALVTAGGPIVQIKSLDGPTFSGSDAGHQANWSILVSEADLTYLINGLFPPAVVVAGPNGNISIKPPNQLLPNSGFFYATNYTARPFGETLGDPFKADPTYETNFADWERTYAKLYQVDITFSTKPDGRTEDDDQENPNDVDSLIDDKSVDIGAEFLRIGDNNIKWGDNNEPNDSLEVGVNQQIPQLLWTLTRRRVLNPDWAQIAKLIGNVNQELATQQTLGIDAQAECALFLGASGRLTGGWNGQSEWEMSYKFAVREMIVKDGNGADVRVTWNHFFRPSAAEWQKLKIVGTDGTMRDVYEKGDLPRVFDSV